MFECYTREIPYSNMTAIIAAYSVAKENFRPTVPHTCESTEEGNNEEMLAR